MKKLSKILKNSEKAITLIALVITIIVLLILAGISIAILAGDNSILQRSTYAKERTGIAEVVENAKLDVLAQIAENKGEKISKGQLKSILNTYFDDIDNLELPDDLSNSDIKLNANQTYGGYKNIALSDIYNGKFKDSINSDINTIGINISSVDSIISPSSSEVVNCLGFTDLYDKSKENDLIKQLIATGEINYLSSDGESAPTEEEVRNHIQSSANTNNFSFEEQLSSYLISYNIIPATITITANGGNDTIPYYNNCFRCIGNPGDENSYTIIIESNGKRGEKTVTLTTPSTHTLPSFPTEPTPAH